ncbi:MAG: hypothetical protein GSR72_04460 [Desulfurococcales archaeon]|nr:hypothetical protein [Desulfurococcales archaeon]
MRKYSLVAPAFIGVSLFYAMMISDEIIGALIVKYGLAEFAGLFSILILGIAVLQLVHPIYTIVLAVLWVITSVAAQQVNLHLLGLLLVIIALSNIYRVGRFNPPYATRIDNVKTILYPLGAIIGVAILLGAPVYIIVTRLPALVTSWASTIPGDIGVFLKSVAGTLLASFVIILLSLYVLFKAYDSLTSLFLAMKPGYQALSEYELRRDYEDWKKKLVLFEGKQGGALREGLIIVYSLLFSPVIFPATRTLFVSLAGEASTSVTVAYMFTGYLIAWLITRILIIFLFSPPPIKDLYKPLRPTSYLSAGILFSLAIITVYYIMGGDLYSLAQAFLLGRSPGVEDPIATNIQLENLGDRVDQMIKLLDEGLQTLVLLLWGG